MAVQTKMILLNPFLLDFPHLSNCITHHSASCTKDLGMTLDWPSPDLHPSASSTNPLPPRAHQLSAPTFSQPLGHLTNIYQLFLYARHCPNPGLGRMQSKSLPPLTSFLVGQPYITAAPSCLLLSVCLLRSSLQSPDSDYSTMLKISTWPWEAW